MKKVVSLILGVLFALGLFAVTGSPVQAEEPGDDCTCHNLVPLTGAERNKIVAELLGSEAFKAEKAKLLAAGQTWNGADTIEVVVPPEGVTMVGVPFISADGVLKVHVFINGTYVGIAPEE